MEPFRPGAENYFDIHNIELMNIWNLFGIEKSWEFKSELHKGLTQSLS